MVFAMVVTGCMKEDFGDFIPNEPIANSNSVIALTTDRLDGIVSLSVGAPQEYRQSIWIDLNADGVRAEDGTEDISVFNTYQDYKLAPNLKTVSIYGDITYFASASNELTEIDIKGNPYLSTLNVPLNRLATLDISKNTALTGLDCSHNSITTLDISENKALVTLWSFNNKLSKLNLSNNPALTFLDCSGNQLNALDVSRNNELVRLICYNNLLSALDISKNNKLKRLWIYGNPLSNEASERIISVVEELPNVDLLISG